VPNHPFRAYNISQTANIAHKGLIPSVNSTGIPIVGVYGAIRDATTFDALTEQPDQIIDTITSNQDTFLTRQYFYYKQVGDRLYHTRTNAVIDVCTFSWSATLTSIEANGDAPIPDNLFDVAVAGLIAGLVNDEEWVNQSALFGAYFERCLEEMKQGSTAFAPGPVLVSSQQPAIS
jgi:hypothetical protein